MKYIEFLYKYKSLGCRTSSKEFKHACDIIKNGRIWTSRYDELNDSAEGDYYYNPNKTNPKYIELIKETKRKLRICCLSKLKYNNNKIENNPLMWGHYADGGRGILIEVLIKKPNNIIKQDSVKYSSDFSFTPTTNNDDDAIKILSKKHCVWSYENEYRIFIEEKEEEKEEGKYIPVKVVRVIMGIAIKDRMRTKLKNICEEQGIEIKKFEDVVFSR